MRTRPFPFRRTPSQSGYTLVELSVVLTIIALVTGGLMAGRSLLEAAETRAIYTDANTYIAAVGQFEDKYGGLPGDLYNAESIWGQAAAGAACATTNNNDKTTCNGDGDGQIDYMASVEIFRAWQQLNNAGLLEAHMTGIAGSGGIYHGIPGTNIPRGVIDGSGYTLAYQGSAGCCAMFAATDYRHMLLFGTQTATSFANGPVITAARMYEIDQKIDDGRPGTGTLRSRPNATEPNCATTDNTATAVYDVDNVNIGCGPVFVGLF